MTTDVEEIEKNTLDYFYKANGKVILIAKVNSIILLLVVVGYGKMKTAMLI